MIVEELVSRLGLSIDSEAFEKAGELIEGLHNGMIALGAAAVGAAVIGLAAMIHETAEAGEEASHLAQATGLSTDQLQELGYAASLSHVPMETLAHAMQHLARTGVKDVNGEMERLANQFAAMPDDGNKVALAMAKFGRAGAEIIPLLNKGGEEIRKLRAEARASGNVMGKDALRGAEKYNESLVRLGKAFTGLRNQIAIPFLEPLAKAFEFVGDHVDVIVSALKVLGLGLGGLGVIFAVTQAAAIGAALKMAAAWAAALLPVIALGLILDDVIGYFQGKDSLIGRLDQFLQKFSQPNPGDPWWLAALREAVYFVQHLYEIIPNLFDKIGALKDKYTNWVGGGDGGHMSPLAAAAYAATTPGGKTITQTVNAPITVHAAPGMSASDVAGHVAQALRDHTATQMRQAAAGIE